MITTGQLLDMIQRVEVEGLPSADAGEALKVYLLGWADALSALRDELETEI